MLALMDPHVTALGADAAATTFDVTYTVDEKGNQTLQIPVSVTSDGSSLAVQCPPVAVPIGTWNLHWNFTLDPTNVPPVLISISQLMEIPGYISVKAQPPAQPVKV